MPMLHQSCPSCPSQLPALLTNRPTTTYFSCCKILEPEAPESQQCSIELYSSRLHSTAPAAAHASLPGSAVIWSIVLGFFLRYSWASNSGHILWISLPHSHWILTILGAKSLILCYQTCFLNLSLSMYILIYKILDFDILKEANFFLFIQNTLSLSSNLLVQLRAKTMTQIYKSPFVSLKAKTFTVFFLYLF